ncbi:hypothetical protein HK103_005010 [Boothiomyces macroporosus]|uniref:Uncharacterized protein n=1 Tax=Boothiomyces macroporosus TaxID=261099 RepID=A0AAD5UFS9_9FUNG|nr:hypothetical protein HK103_005010 [Boothiomyces macroporosus]
MIVFLIATTAFTMGSRYMYEVSGFHDIEFNGATFDYSFGLFSFSYRMTDDGGDAVNSAYPTEWQVVSYKDACSTINFATDSSNGQMIDISFFCNSRSPWQMVTPFMVFAIILGTLALGLLIANGIAFGTFHLWSNKCPCANRFCLRRFFKSTILMCVLLHFVFQLSVVLISGGIVFFNLVSFPTHLSFGIGTFISVYSLFNDLFFMIMFVLMYDNMFLWNDISIQ